MTPWWPYVLVPLVGFATWFATGRLVDVLVRRQILDRPNERSSHEQPTPRGGGLAVVAVLLPALTLVWIARAPDALVSYAVPLAMLALAAVSWLDDLRSLGAPVRLAVHLGASAAACFALPTELALFDGLLPLWLDRVVCAFALTYFINIFNFMDGIDGISGVETMAIGVGVFAVTSVLIWPGAPEGLLVAAAALGFLGWNWHPAKVFLGDVGSVPLGFVTGWMLLQLALAGLWLPALLLPGYYLVDATSTLIRRLLRGERIWQAHREHTYQHAVRHGMSHAAVSIWVGLTGIDLVICAVLAVAWHWAAGLFPALVVLALSIARLRLAGRSNGKTDIS